eukprot:49650-Pyramimonas_sp.AAC.1
MNGGGACGLCHRDLRQSSYGSTKRVKGVPKLHTHKDLRWSSRWGHETCEGWAEMGVRDACAHTH